MVYSYHDGAYVKRTRDSPVIDPKVVCGELYRGSDFDDDFKIGFEGVDEVRGCGGLAALDLGPVAAGVDDSCGVKHALSAGQFGKKLCEKAFRNKVEEEKVDGEGSIDLEGQVSDLESDSESSIEPSSASQSPEIKPLSDPWVFPVEARYHKSTTGSIDGYTQSDLEELVTSGLILENINGLQWTYNKRYLLFRCDTKEDNSLHDWGPKSSTRPCMDVQSLFAASEPVAPDIISNPSQDSIAVEQKGDGHALWQKCGIRKMPSADFSERLPFPPGPEVQLQPLSQPWKFPSKALYKEAFPDSTKTLSLGAIQLAVTRGALIADTTGLLIPGSSPPQYLLIYTGERDENERVYTRRIERVKCEVAEKPPTPIVEEDEYKSPRLRKIVRFNASSSSLDRKGKEQLGAILDNEGKTARLRLRQQGEC